MLEQQAQLRRRTLSPVGSDWPSELPPLLDRVYRGRGMRFASDLDLSLSHLPHPGSLPDIDLAAELLAHSVQDGSPVVVVGDYDADGATGTALAVRGLRMLGHPDVRFRVPDRVRHGYGLSPALVEELDPDIAVLVTVDHGSTSHAGVRAANARGFKVLVTDHHLLADELPSAAALVNPQRTPSSPLRSLCGAGVMFYVLAAVRQHLRGRGWFSQARFAGAPEPVLSTLLDLVALGTVADLVPLTTLNRSLVDAGLKRIRAHQACAGVQALLQVAGRNPRRTQASDLGFAVAPRINAAGRLDDMSIGVRCLLSDDPIEALALANQLNSLNLERRELQADMQARALEAVELGLARFEGRQLPSVLVLGDPGWHPGVVGLVASKLVERHHRPAFAFAPSGAGDGEWRGSGRSIADLHLRDGLVEVDAMHPGLLVRYGGHAMAAGLSIRAEAFPSVVLAMQAVFQSKLTPELGTRWLDTDGALAGEEFSLAHATLLEQAGPFGQQFPEPLFDDAFILISAKRLKERHWKLRVKNRFGALLDALWFNSDDDLPAPGCTLHLAFQLMRNEFRDEQQLQLLVRSAWQA